jgi:hypothetical protein
LAGYFRFRDASCRPGIWLNKADPGETEINSSPKYDQERALRRKEYELKIGKGKADMTAETAPKGPQNSDGSIEINGNGGEGAK